MSEDKNSLHKLIKSLSKSEKRHFKLFASRHTIGEKNNTIILFDKLEQLKKYDEERFLQKHKDKNFAKHFRFNKHFLYKLVLKSLHAYHSSHTAEAELREQLHYIEILLDKGLYKQCLQLISSAKRKANQYENFALLFELMKKEAELMRDQNYANVSEKDLDKFFTEYKEVLNKMKEFARHESQSAKILMTITREGFVRKKESAVHFEKLLSEIRTNEKGMENFFHFNHSLYRSHYVSAFLQRDFEKANQWIDKTLELFEKHPHMKQEHMRAFAIVLHNKIVTLNNLKCYDQVQSAVDKLKELRPRSQNIRNRIFYSTHNIILTMYNDIGEFETGLELLKVMEKKLATKEVSFANIQNEVTHNFSSGCCNFGVGNFIVANKYFQKVTDRNDLGHRSDLLCFSKILRMMIQFETGKQDLLEYSVKSTFRFLSQRNRIYKFEDTVLSFIRTKMPDMNSNKEIIEGFKQLHSEFLKLSKMEFEKNAFEYFDFISWLESKITGKSFSEILKKKAGIIAS